MGYMLRVYLLLFVLWGFGFEAFAQLPDAVADVKHYDFGLQLNDANNIIKGNARVDVRYLKNSDSFSLNLVKINKKGKGMRVSAVSENNTPLKFEQDSDNVIIYAPAKQGEEHSYEISYAGIPADGLIISNNMFGHRTFFGDNWPNRARNWLPCVDDPADKATVDFTVTAPDHYQVVANGAKVSETALPGHLKLTHWHESAKLPTKVMVIGVADFAIDSSANIQGIPVSAYVFNENEGRGFIDYMAAQTVLPFYIKTIGPFPYEKLANVQSKTIFGGMENASAIFYYEKSVGDKGIESLMAHEIAHQWFGDAVTEKSWQHLWLSEGFATYMTDLYLQNRYGPDTLKKLLQAQREKVIGFSKKRMTPVVDTAVTGNYIQLLNANSYEKGAWVLHMLQNKVGDHNFGNAISAYYKLYTGKNANTDDLRRVFENVSGLNLKPFFKQWLYTAGQPKLKITHEYDEASKILSLHIEQLQDVLFDFTLPVSFTPGITLSAFNKVYNFNVKDRVTTVQVALTANPVAVNIDPDINLLFEQVTN